MNTRLTDSDSESDDSQSYVSHEEEEPEEVEERVGARRTQPEFDEDYDYYQEEPEADDEWLKEYNSVMETAEEKLNTCKSDYKGKFQSMFGKFSILLLCWRWMNIVFLSVIVTFLKMKCVLTSNVPGKTSIYNMFSKFLHS